MKHESKLRFTDEEQSDDENAGVESAETADAGMRQMAARSRKARQRRNTKGAERPRLSGNPFSRWQQKRAIQKRYTAARRRTQAAEETTKSATRATKRIARTANKATASIVRHRRGILIAAILFLLVALIGGTVSSCAAMLQGGLASVAGSTYPCADADMLGAEAVYSAKEAELQAYLDSYELTHSYDEYVYDLDGIKHDPYVLISFLTACHSGGWTLADAEPTLDLLFGRQYKLTESVTTETRYHGDGEPYTVTICTVTLENFDLSHLPVYLLSEEQLAMYAGYMKTLGNRPDLFPADAYPYASRRTDYLRYEVPPEALTDETFAAMLREAEKYLGYPYVWGGSSPATSFDCSGFVSWVINHSGWNVGRLGATSLYNICTPVSPANARPGDLVFFQGTYDTAGMSHVGIYVGNGMMLHCGNPISYANLNTTYWQDHFAAYGRLP